MLHKKKKKLKKAVLLLFPLLIAYYIVSVYFVNEVFYYHSSKSMVSYIIYGIIILTSLFMVLFTFKGFSCLKKNKIEKYIPYFILLIIFILGEGIVAFNLNKISNSLSKITDKESGYSTSLITLKSNNINKNNINEALIGIINDSNNIEGNKLALELAKEKEINNNNLKYYDDFNLMLNALYEKEIDAMFISSSYVSMFVTTEGYENIADETKEIYKKTKAKEKVSTATTKTLTEPFTLLIMGVDSDSKSLATSNSFNGDTLMLITFNPTTMNATILSIPRDTRVPIACSKWKSKNKINSSAYYGAECVMDTITEFTGIEIDYWVKVNFQGVMSIVDALGGIEVDIPYAFCESSENRSFGNETIYVEKGLQTLDGRKALAFARNRHPWPQYCPRKYSNYNSNDFIRGQNQQALVKATVNKLKTIKSLDGIYNLLNIVGDNIDTNIDKDTMMTGFDTFKNILINSRNIKSDDFIGTQRLYLSGYDNMINGIYYFEYYKQSLEEVVNAMKINLELIEPTMDKEFSFSINNPYEDKQIGKGTYKY